MTARFAAGSARVARRQVSRPDGCRQGAGATEFDAEAARRVSPRSGHHEAVRRFCFVLCAPLLTACARLHALLRCARAACAVFCCVRRRCFACVRACVRAGGCWSTRGAHSIFHPNVVLFLVRCHRWWFVVVRSFRFVLQCTHTGRMHGTWQVHARDRVLRWRCETNVLCVLFVSD